MPNSQIIDIRISDLRQLFNSLDPSPFIERDFDREAEEFIVRWADEYPLQSPLGVVIRDPPVQLDQARQSNVPQAVHNYFSYRTVASARGASGSSFAKGRFALLLGLGFLAIRVLLRQLAGSIMPPPLQQLFLYDRWPVRHHGQLYRKLARMKVSVLAALPRLALRV